MFCLPSILGGCTPPRATLGLITVVINADGKSYQVQIPTGSTVQDALTTAGLSAGDLDRSNPPTFTVLSDGSEVRLVRVREEYYIEQEVIPFEHQELRNEALTIGESLLSQPGVNGLQEITYLRIFEDNVEILQQRIYCSNSDHRNLDLIISFAKYSHSYATWEPILFWLPVVILSQTETAAIESQ